MNNPLSNCCGSPPLGDIEHGMCSDCRDHAEFEEGSPTESEELLADIESFFGQPGLEWRTTEELRDLIKRCREEIYNLNGELDLVYMSVQTLKTANQNLELEISILREQLGTKTSKVAEKNVHLCRVKLHDGNWWPVKVKLRVSENDQRVSLAWNAAYPKMDPCNPPVVEKAGPDSDWIADYNWAEVNQIESYP